MKKFKTKDIKVIVCLIVIFIFLFEITDVINSLLYRDYTLNDLTKEEKIEDFECFYSNMLESAPYLDDVKELYGIDWKERKDYYLSEVKATESSVEYYGVMAAISQDLASFHTDICFPLYSNLLGINCYNSEDVMQQFGVEAKINAWNEEIGKAAIAYEDVNLFCVKYVDEKYILKEGWLSDTYKDMANYELVSVDGISVDKYVVENISIYGLGYDALWNKAYRENYTFNDSIGDEVEVVWKNLEGKEIKQILYIDKGVEVVASYGYLFSDRYDYYAKTSQSNFVTERDDKNQLEYIQINNFENNDGRELQKQNNS